MASSQQNRPTTGRQRAGQRRSRTSPTGSSGGAPGVFALQSIQQLPALPWDRAEQSGIVAHFTHFSDRFFRGTPGHPEEERSRPAAFLLSYILTRYQGQHLARAMVNTAYLVAEMPQLSPVTVQLFRQSARFASQTGDQDAWLTATVRAIEYGTAQYVLGRISGKSAKSLASRAQAIKRDLQMVTTVLEATKNGGRRLAICYICDLAIRVTQGDYDGTPERLRRCITCLGEEFGMDDIAKQLTSGIVTQEDGWSAQAANATISTSII